MSHRGDYNVSAVVYGKFTTFRPSSGAAFTLAGSPALSVYKDNSTTQSTTGVTLTVDFDSVTGLHHFAIDTSADATFYSAGSNFDVVITAGTVDSVSVVGAVVASFSILKTSRQVRRRATAQAGSTSTITLDSGASAVDDFYNGMLVTALGGTGANQAPVQIVDYVGATKVATVYVAGPPIQGKPFVTAPDSTTVFELTDGPGITPLPINVTAGEVAATLSATQTAAVADKILGRNITGGADGTRTVKHALSALRNKWTLVGTTLTVYDTDDTTALWTATVSLASRDPLTASDPA